MAIRTMSWTGRWVAVIAPSPSPASGRGWNIFSDLMSNSSSRWRPPSSSALGLLIFESAPLEQALPQPIVQRLQVELWLHEVIAGAQPPGGLELLIPRQG